jgi:hypothetical protein
MEKIVKKVYLSLYQKTSDVTYKEQLLLTVATIGFTMAIIITMVITL